MGQKQSKGRADPSDVVRVALENNVHRKVGPTQCCPGIGGTHLDQSSAAVVGQRQPYCASTATEAGRCTRLLASPTPANESTTIRSTNHGVQF